MPLDPLVRLFADEVAAAVALPDPVVAFDRSEDLRPPAFGDGEVGTALCLDALARCPDPVAACRELHRVVADGGLCVLAAPMLGATRGESDDYFRYTPSGLRVLLEPFDDVWSDGLGDPGHPLWAL